jgi:hypothetical protein
MTGTHSRISYQDAVIEDITHWANQRGLRVLTEYRYSNQGVLSIGSTTNIVASIDFSFNAGGKNILLINGAKHGPPGPDNYFFGASDTDRYKAFLARLRFLLCRDRHIYDTKTKNGVRVALCRNCETPKEAGA